MLKFLTVLIALVICVVRSIDRNRVVHVCTDISNVPAQCLVVGNANVPGDRVLVDDTYEKYPIPLIVRTDDLVLPRGGDSSNFLITFIQVSNPGDSGLVTMVAGGVNERTVGLHLEAPRGHGYHFNVVIKGMPIVSPSLRNINPLNSTESYFLPAAPADLGQTPNSI